MKFTVKERILLLQVLPPTGDMTTLKIVRDTQDALTFREEEHKQFKLEAAIVDGSIRGYKWDTSADVAVDIPIGDKAFQILLEGFQKLDREKNLTLDTLKLYERFLEVKQNAA